VGFHEVGAVDSIVDIVAACAGIESLGVGCVAASELVEGSGTITCAHGEFPLPSPATLAILEGIPLRQTNFPHEMITPTGAAILAEYATSFGPMPSLRIEAIGYGPGTRDTPPRPNVLRAILGNAAGDDNERDEIVVMETNLDDMSPELVSAAIESALRAGALDAFCTPVQMKKGRPGWILCLLAEPDRAEDLARLLLRETSSFGVRMHPSGRIKLARKQEFVQTPFGPVAIKVGLMGGRPVKASPEFESCRRAAEAAGAAVADVYHAAQLACPRPSWG